jgi:hypothetical protein
VNPSKARTQDSFLKEFGEDGIKIADLKKVADGLGMHVASISGTKKFLPERISELLKLSSVLFVGYVVSNPGQKKPWWHAVVLYDMNILQGTEACYNIMDPGPNGTVATLADSEEAQYVDVRRKYFFPRGDKEQWLIGWSKKRPRWQPR